MIKFYTKFKKEVFTLKKKLVIKVATMIFYNDN